MQDFPFFSLLQAPFHLKYIPQNLKADLSKKKISPHGVLT